MCTVTWIAAPGSFWLFSNRDEKLTRSMAAAPQIHERNGTRIICPRDRAFGGTWIGINEFGIAACLLNGRGGAPPMAVSRGLLALDALEATSVDQVEERVAAHELSRFAPFSMIVLSRISRPVIVAWDGEELETSPGADRGLLVSSSFDPDGVLDARSRQFDPLSTPVSLENFHASHSPMPGPYSPCMHRADAETVSFTRVSAADGLIELHYQAGGPCKKQDRKTVILCRNSFSSRSPRSPARILPPPAPALSSHKAASA